MLHVLWEGVRGGAWVLTWAVYGVYVAACLAMALGIVALVVSMGLALIPDRKPPAAEGRDARP